MLCNFKTVGHFSDGIKQSRSGALIFYRVYNLLFQLLPHFFFLHGFERHTGDVVLQNIEIEVVAGFLAVCVYFVVCPFGKRTRHVYVVFCIVVRHLQRKVFILKGFACAYGNCHTAYQH